MFKVKFLAVAACVMVGALVNTAEAAPSSVYKPKAACLVVDVKSGKILYQQNPNTPVHPASLTKMMTLYIVFQQLQSGKLSLQKQFLVSTKAANQAPSKLGLKAGQWVSVNDLILAVVTRSANDAATVLAEGVGKNEASFVSMMNQQAKSLGMNKTTFCNPSGLPDPKQVTTAADMVTLGEALLRNQPNYYAFFGTRAFTYKGQKVTSHNHMLDSYPGTDGIKTGYVSASGFNIVTSVVRNNRRLLGVIFGSPSAKARDIRMATILDQCFKMPA